MISHLLCDDDACSAQLEKVCSRLALDVSDVRASSRKLHDKLSQAAHGVSGEVALRKREHSSLELAALATLLEFAKVPYTFYDERGLSVVPSPYYL